MAKTIEKEDARKLRLEGKSINEIAKLLVVAKSSVSLWVRDLPQPEQFTPEVVGEEKREKRKRIEAKKAEMISNRVFLDKLPYVGWQMYKPYLMKKTGRYYVGLKKDGIWKMMSLARLNMEISIGRELSPEEHVDHIDENKLNDKIENLQILHPADNNRKARSHGKMPSLLDMARGEDSGNSKFSNIEVNSLRKEFLQGNYTIKDFSKKYRISYQSMSDILRGVSYKEVPMPDGLKEITNKKVFRFPTKYDSEFHLKIKGYLEKGYSAYKIAKTLRIPNCTAYYLVKKHNLIPSSSQA